MVSLCPSIPLAHAYASARDRGQLRCHRLDRLPPISRRTGADTAGAAAAGCLLGSATSYICKACGVRFMARDGGGFFFDLLHCDTCGDTRSVSHEDLGEIHLGFVKGLPGPYAVGRSAMDRRIKETYEGEPLSRDQYHAAAQATLDACGCGGRFTYDAPARCPECRSTEDRWEEDPEGPMIFID